MKLEKTGVEVNSRVVVVESQEPSKLGAIGYIISKGVACRAKGVIALLVLDADASSLPGDSYPLDSRIDLLDSDVVVEIPEDTSDMIMAAGTNIPINERVKIVKSPIAERIGAVGYITNSRKNVLLAAIWVEFMEGKQPSEMVDIEPGEQIIRYPAKSN